VKRLVTKLVRVAPIFYDVRASAPARIQDIEVIRAYREVESGRRADRPELVRGVAHAKGSGAVLVMGVDFMACDNPLTVHILASVAEDEARRYGERTRAPWPHIRPAAAPGAPRLTDRAKWARSAGAAARAKADAAYADLAPAVGEWRAAGLSLRSIAARLNAEGQTTRRMKAGIRSRSRGSSGGRGYDRCSSTDPTSMGPRVREMSTRARRPVRMKSRGPARSRHGGKSRPYQSPRNEAGKLGR